jgi:hypothetical protein
MQQKLIARDPYQLYHVKAGYEASNWEAYLSSIIFLMNSQFHGFTLQEKTAGSTLKGTAEQIVQNPGYRLVILPKLLNIPGADPSRKILSSFDTVSSVPLSREWSGSGSIARITDRR